MDRRSFLKRTFGVLCLYAVGSNIFAKEETAADNKIAINRYSEELNKLIFSEKLAQQHLSSKHYLMDFDGDELNVLLDDDDIFAGNSKNNYGKLGTKVYTQSNSMLITHK